MENQKRETLATRLEKIKSLSQLKRLDESATKQAIVLPILQALGWDTSDIDEVYPEYSVEKKRVDYSLRLAGRNEFFLEIKKPEEDLGKHDEQLLDYSFRQGVKLAALSNGITWLFYLPMKECQWEARKFYAIDIIEQDIDNVVGKFVAILSREAVQTGEAKRLADAMFASALRKRTFDEKIPEAWNKLIAERDDQLKELLADRTEKLCGFKPGEAELLSFFELWKSRLIVPEPPTPPARPTMVKRVGGEEREHTVPQRISLLGETAVRLRVSLDEANSELQSIQHDTFQIGLAKSWLPDESGRVKAQGVCWLFCWAKTGMKSPKTAYRAKEAFNKILSVSYEDFDERVPHDWARTARYKKENMEKELAGLLRGVNT